MVLKVFCDAVSNFHVNQTKEVLNLHDLMPEVESGFATKYPVWV